MTPAISSYLARGRADLVQHLLVDMPQAFVKLALVLSGQAVGVPDCHGYTKYHEDGNSSFHTPTLQRVACEDTSVGKVVAEFMRSAK